jgi:multimeric flavodoxin WrbA
MEDKKVIILGSSRKNGNTTRIADEISKETGIEVINLSDYNISYYIMITKVKTEKMIFFL